MRSRITAGWWMFGGSLCVVGTFVGTQLSGCASTTCEENLNCPGGRGLLDGGFGGQEGGPSESGAPDATHADSSDVNVVAPDAGQDVVVDSGWDAPDVSDGQVLDGGVPPPSYVYLSPVGLDSGEGTRAHPVRTLARALRKATETNPPRVIRACSAGSDGFSSPFAVQASSSGQLTIEGGFDCDTWAAGQPTPVVAPVGSIPLTIANIASGITIRNFVFKALDATEPGGHVVAAFVSSSTNVVFENVKFVAGNGKDGAHGVPTVNYALLAANDPAIAGNSAVEATGAAEQSCVTLCANGQHSTGGRGGNGSLAGGPTSGGDGAPALGGVSPFDGKGGIVAPLCNGGHPGANGDPGGGSDGAQRWGALSASGWKGQNGQDGVPGEPGQGGGGGAGMVSSSGNGGGGGGGCGGCGGGGGRGGQAGGSSFALLSYQSKVTLKNCTLTAGEAGSGGNGSEGQTGQAGGEPGAPSSGGCTGGSGGTGGKGGPSGGGAGGLSSAIGWVGIEVAADSTNFLEVKGTRKPGGEPGGFFGADAGVDAAGDASPVNRDGGALRNADRGIDGLVGNVLKLE